MHAKAGDAVALMEQPLSLRSQRAASQSEEAATTTQPDVWSLAPEKMLTESQTERWEAQRNEARERLSDVFTDMTARASEASSSGEPIGAALFDRIESSLRQLDELLHQQQQTRAKPRAKAFTSLLKPFRGMAGMGMFASKESRAASAEFKKLARPGKGKQRVSHKEMEAFVGQHVELWAMLSVNLGLSDDRCREIAATVALEQFGSARASVALSENIAPVAQRVSAASADSSAKGSKRSSAQSMRRSDFVAFRKGVLNNPKGQQLFFHRCVFAAYDADGNGTLDPDELDNFLDVFYKAGSIFAGDSRLPPKDELRRLIYEKLDANRDGVLNFEEIHGLISGSAAQTLSQR